MYSINSNGSRAAWAGGFMALWAVLAMGLGMMARPAEAAPFAYVANSGSDIVSAIDTASNTVVATVTVGNGPYGVAVTPDGKRGYVVNFFSNTVSVFATATNKVVATIAFAVGSNPTGVAVTPDGKHAYVPNSNPSGTVSVIDTASNNVVATVPVGSVLVGIAFTLDGEHAKSRMLTPPMLR
jgi:YVTN family beta-propeller protein